MRTLQLTHRFDFVFLEENIRQRNTDQIRSNTTPRFYILILKWANITATNIIYKIIMCTWKVWAWEVRKRVMMRYFYLPDSFIINNNEISRWYKLYAVNNNKCNSNVQSVRVRGILSFGAKDEWRQCFCIFMFNWQLPIGFFTTS